jgi:hypothetical protein
MKILALEHELPNRDPTEFQPLLIAEARRVWQLYQGGIIREIYFRDDQNTAVLALECASSTECRRILDTLPLVQAGLIHFELIPLKPYTGLARLFAPSSLP